MSIPAVLYFWRIRSACASEFGWTIPGVFPARLCQHGVHQFVHVESSVGSSPSNDTADSIAVPERFIQILQKHDADAFPQAYPLARSSNFMLIRYCDIRILGALRWLLTCNSGHQETKSPIEKGPRVHQVRASAATPLLSSSCSHQYEWTGSQGTWRPYCWSKQCPERPKSHGGHRNEKAGLPAL